VRFLDLVLSGECEDEFVACDEVHPLVDTFVVTGDIEGGLIDIVVPERVRGHLWRCGCSH
jgi:hypothetical protein